jgi:hypothetical protein
LTHVVNDISTRRPASSTGATGSTSLTTTTFVSEDKAYSRAMLGANPPLARHA